MTFTKEQIAEAAATMRRRQASRRSEEQTLWKQAADDATRIVQMIAARYPVARIWQWGSVLEKTKFRSYSDIDIAIEGLNDAAAYFELLGEAEKLTAFPLDIVELERIMPEFSDIIQMKGRVVYERS